MDRLSAPFVFNNPLPPGVAPAGTANPRGNSTDDLFLGLTMQSQWISFAVHLDPNFHGGNCLCFILDDVYLISRSSRRHSSLA